MVINVGELVLFSAKRRLGEDVRARAVSMPLQAPVLEAGIGVRIAAEPCAIAVRSAHSLPI